MGHLRTELPCVKALQVVDGPQTLLRQTMGDA